MKIHKFILSLFIFTLFYNGSCEKPRGQYFLTIQNNSDKEIIFQGSLYSSMQDTTCFNIKAWTTMEYQNFIYDRLIKPYSSRKIEIDMTVGFLQTHPNNIWSVGIFNRIDIDTMSCEEFIEKYPLKHEWRVTLADMESSDWTLVYP